MSSISMTWLKANIVAICIGLISFIGAFTSNQVSVNSNFTSIELRLDRLEKSSDERKVYVNEFIEMKPRVIVVEARVDAIFPLMEQIQHTLSGLDKAIELTGNDNRHTQQQLQELSVTVKDIQKDVQDIKVKVNYSP